jgi:hypothetical protein
MTLINSTLISGLLLAALPIVLHFIMRARPKKIEFPALQLLKSRHVANRRRFQLRHLLLLMLRCLLICALVLLVARPSLPAARYGLLPREWIVLGSITAICVFLYYWLSRHEPSAQAQQYHVRIARGRRRMWCVLAGILAAALAVGLPWGMRIRAEWIQPSGELAENIPVAAVLIVDTSISMNYQHQNLTRLQQARTVAEQHISQLPAGSRVAVAGLSADEDIVFQADLAGAASRLESLAVTSVPRSLNRAIKAAIEEHQEDRERVKAAVDGSGAVDRYVREICLITDLSQTAWKYPDDSGIAAALAEHDWLQLYLLDVSVRSPINYAISEPKLSEDVTTTNSEISLTVSVSGVGAGTASSETSAAGSKAVGAEATVDAFLLNPDGSERRVGRQRVALSQGGTETQFSIAAPVGQTSAEGILRISSADPLPDDNIRYFSFGVRKPPRVLFVSEDINEAFFLRNVLQPEEASKIGRILYDCTSITTTQASQYSLNNFDVVCLINCNSPDPSLWSSLKGFVDAGGGAFVVLGSDRISANRWRTPESRAILPGLPIRQFNFPEVSAVLRIADPHHSITQAFQSSEEARTELSRAMFDKRWAVEVLPDTRILMDYDAPGNPPALLERQAGSGTCVMFTSAADNLSEGGSLWNNLVVDNWAFLMLSEEIMRALTGASVQRANFIAGEPVEFTVPVSERFSHYLVRRPGGRQTRSEQPSDQSSVLITDALDTGHYSIRPHESPSPFLKTFAVNFPEAESDLTTIPEERLIEILGKDGYTTARDVNELEQASKVGRLGIEVFPVLMGLAIILLCAEHLMANYFYDDEPEPTAAR